MKNNTYDDRNNNYKKYTIFAYITCFIMVLFTTIGYSAMNATVNFKGDVALRVAGDIRITGVSKSSATNNALSTYANFSKTTLALGTTMPANSTITYSFKIKNSSFRVGLLTNLVTTGTNAKATQNLSLTVTPSTSNIIASSSRIPSSTENTYTITLTNNTSNTVTDQRLLTFTYNYIYKITYNLNGGSLSNTNPTEYFPGQSITLNNPTRSGYTFEGWTGSNGSTKSKSVKVDTSKNMDLSYTANFISDSFLYQKLISSEASDSTYATGIKEIKAKGNPDFSKTAPTDEGMYAMKDDYGTSYYYRGAVPDNWVSFGGFLWRVIRVNGDNTVRMIYSGTTSSHTGEGTQIGKSAFNSTYNSPKYVGYMYGDSDTTENEAFKNKNDSTIKGVIDNWYKNNLSSYSSLIADEVFCNDRTLASGSTYSTSSNFNYATSNRLSTNKSPQLTCPNLARDGFTTTTASIGNKALTYPAGLITADEVSLAGGVQWTDNKSYYLYTGQGYRALSASFWSSGFAYGFCVGSNGDLDNYSVGDSGGVRPVVSLRTSTLVTSGTGTETDPYVIE